MKTQIEWVSQAFLGRERCILEYDSSGYSLSGDAELSINDQPIRLQYRVLCDREWRTKAAHVAGGVGHTAVDISIRVEAGQIWLVGGQEQPHMWSCIDIDLGFTPATNTIPIRRLELAPGEEAEIKTVWLKLPEIELVPLRQTYKRISLEEYLYHSENAGSSALLKVNALGLVTEYPGLWCQV